VILRMYRAARRDRSRPSCHRPVVAIGAAALLLSLAAACEDRDAGGSSSYDVAKPAHPAMSAEARKGRDAPAIPHDHPHPHAELPPDHPPLPERGGRGLARDGGGAPVGLDGPVEVAGLVFDPPEGWIREPPANAMREAQFSLPAAAAGEEAGLVTVSRAGGSVDDNIRRWESQFEGSPRASIDRREVSGFEVVTAVIDGAYVGMGGSQPARAGWRQHAVIVQAPEGQLFVKAVGPAATLERWKESFTTLVDSFRRAR